ncbi:MAG TPA: outer membrane lipid asymmetry maintenance protein MlaD [Acetobacteraceae bacterium]|nr:outer membrane lipid asymmetry maintenance protein MlaD [Acetobacteraceae bacterium]
MPQRNVAELAAGAVVLAVAIGFLGYAVANTGRFAEAGYTLHARFNAVDGLANGSDVRLAGVKVGSVTGMHLDPQTYQAVVDFTVAPDIKLPKDSSAAVTSDGLLGGKYLGLQPGGETDMIPPGGQVTITQSSISIEQLLGKFIFSVGNLSAGGQKQGGQPQPQQPQGGELK